MKYVQIMPVCSILLRNGGRETFYLYVEYNLRIFHQQFWLQILHPKNKAKQDAAASESSSSRRGIVMKFSCQDIRLWSIDFGHWILEFRHWTLEFGHRILEFGH